MSVELVINKQLETQTSQYSQVYLPGGVITGTMFKTILIFKVSYDTQIKMLTLNR